METAAIQTESYLTFRLNDEIFAASVNKVLEILEIPKITHVPRCPPYMRGVVNLRGSVLPVIDTRAKFGLLKVDDSINTCIIVTNLFIEGQQIVIGTIADAVQEVMEIGNNAIQPTPSVGSKYKTEFITGMVRYNEQFIMLLDLDKLFSDEEALILSEISSSRASALNQNSAN